MMETEQEKWWRGCPCIYDTPCHPHCTCIHPGSSRGCMRCCTFGSVEQRKARAKRFLRDEKELVLWRKVGSLVTDHSQYCDCERCKLRDELARILNDKPKE